MPLENSVVKISEDMGLNPDQVQNLVQLANTLAHLSLFDQKDDGDKIVNFSPADPDNVMKQIYADGATPEAPTNGDAMRDLGPSQDSASDFFGDFPDLLGKIKAKMDTAPGIEPDPNGKIASVVDRKPINDARTISKLKKVASEIDDRKQAAAYDYKDELDKLAATFAHLYGPDHGEFEKSAVSIRGQVALPVLGDVRRCLKFPEDAGLVFEKTSCVVDTDNPELQALDNLIKLSSVYRECEEALVYLRSKIGGVL